MIPLRSFLFLLFLVIFIQATYAESKVTILSETFDGAFPQDNSWSVGDSNPSNGLDYWDETSYRVQSGSWSGWSANSGSQSTTTTETIFTEGFEGLFYDGYNGWSIGDSNSNSRSDFWGDTQYTAHSGRWSAWAADIGTYTTTSTEAIFSESFEGAFPGSWIVGDSNGNSGNDYWKDVSYKSNSGSWSGWNAGVGDNSVYGGSNYNNHKYDNYMEAYMYRSVGLSGYDSVTLSYDYWIKSERDYDKLYVRYYDGGWQYKDPKTGDSYGWKSSSYVIPKTATSVGFHFSSDYSVVDEGAYLDNIILTGTKATDVPNSDLHLYDDNMDAYMKRTLDLRGYTGASLTFWYKMPSFENGYDYGQFKVNGVEIKKYETEKTAWEQETIDLSAYAGQTITIEWNFHSDYSVRKEGWYIDDITITGTKTAISQNSVIHQYDDNMDAYMTRQINLAGYSSATLTYDYWLDVERGYDSLKVQTSSDGTNWVDKKTYSEGYDSRASNDPYDRMWLSDSVDLSPYAGSNVYVRFLFHSDYSIHDREGAYLDNIKVEALSSLPDLSISLEDIFFEKTGGS